MPRNCCQCTVVIPEDASYRQVRDETINEWRSICTPCFRALNTRCSCCSERVVNAPAPCDMTYVCRECLQHHINCSNCNRRDHQDRMTEYQGDYFCQRCARDRFYECSDCGNRMERDPDRDIGEDSEDSRCERCASRRVIRDHSYKPTPKFRGEGPRYFGVELEVECGETQPSTVAKAIVNDIGGGFVYAKHDGSLNNGFEVVSHPFSWDWLKNGGGADLWMKILKKLRQTGCRSYNTGTCGMHVHVSRDAFTPTELLRLQRLSYNAPELILRLSRRRASNLNQWARPRDSNISEQVALASGRQGHKRDRYAAINVTEGTVEIRIFRGTCDTDGFFSNLEAVQSLVDFCKTPIGVFPKAVQYLDFVGRNHASYPNLVKTILKEIPCA